MVTKIKKWGNSQALRLSKAVLAEAGIEPGDPVDVTVRKGALVIRPVRRVRGRHLLRELVRRMPGRKKRRAIEWGEPVGREVW
jgi:antitoxin MazE